jgi:phosphoserine aminotransferase
MAAIWNFSAGPAVLPKVVLEQAAAEMMDWRGSGISVMEMSHRGPQFKQILHEALSDFRELLQVPQTHHVLFMQGGAIAQNAIVPLNLMRGYSCAAFIESGAWSAKTIKEFVRYGQAEVVARSVEIADKGTVQQKANTYVPAIEPIRIPKQSAYVHFCANETINGVEFQELPNLPAWGLGDVPLVCDASSNILSRPVDVSAHGLIYGGAQKNIGPAGLTFAIVREDLLQRQALNVCPSAFNYRLVAEQGSMYNTPPTYAIYIAGLVFKWLKAAGGLPAIFELNQRKAQLLYQTIDSSELYVNDVCHSDRSLMNIPFNLRDEKLNSVFLDQAQRLGLIQLKGHQSVGGMRASLYNAMPYEGVVALVEFMRNFEKECA